MPSPMEFFYLYLLAINLGTFALFWSDHKRAAIADWRVPERDLMLMAFLGGWFGAKLAQGITGHSRRAMTFGLRLNGIPFLWALICLAVLPQARDVLIGILA